MADTHEFPYGQLDVEKGEPSLPPPPPPSSMSSSLKATAGVSNEFTRPIVVQERVSLLLKDAIHKIGGITEDEEKILIHEMNIRSIDDLSMLTNEDFVKVFGTSNDSLLRRRRMETLVKELQITETPYNESWTMGFIHMRKQLQRKNKQINVMTSVPFVFHLYAWMMVIAILFGVFYPFT